MGLTVVIKRQFFTLYNLYGFAMSRPIRFQIFVARRNRRPPGYRRSRRWVDRIYFGSRSVLSHELHDLHNDYPLVPEKVTVTKQMPSLHAKIVSHRTQFKRETRTKFADKAHLYRYTLCQLEAVNSPADEIDSRSARSTISTQCLDETVH